MKRLKYSHNNAIKIRRGDRTTWRLFDDKDLSVNDAIELIDKVNEDDPTTWQSIGKGRIDQIVQKRLGDLTREELARMSRGNSIVELLTALRERFGSRVAEDTPIKIIIFTLLDHKETMSNNVVNETINYREVLLYADGGSRGNPGPSASGFALLSPKGEVIVKRGVYLGVTTNNQAEYQSLKFGLEEARQMQVSEVHVFMDSQLVVKQMHGIYRIKNRDLWPIYAAIIELQKMFKRVTYTHIPRELNKLADGVVNRTLDEALKLK